MPTLKFPTVDAVTGKPLPNCSRPITYGIKADTLVWSADSGHEQRRIKSAPKRTFQFQYNILSLTEYQTIRDFYIKVLNVYPFIWTDPVEGVSYAVRFDSTTLQSTQKYHGPKGPAYELQLSLVQVWD